MKQQLLIALSASGEPSELAAVGIGKEHIEELMVQMSMKLLKGGHRLSYGGTLGNQKDQLTKYLIQTAQNWLDEEMAEQADISKPKTWPLLNYSAWPYFNFISPEQRAELVGICQFIDIKPPGVEDADLKPLFENWKTDAEAKYHTSNALTEMRKVSAVEADLRVVWGGKIAKAAGWMAGIVEEIASSLEQDKPTLILGGFGGCAGLVAEFLANKNNTWPDALELKGCADPDRDNLMSSTEKKSLRNRFAKIKQQFESYRSKLHGRSKINGVSPTILLDLLSEKSPRIVIKTVANLAELTVNQK